MVKEFIKECARVFKVTRKPTNLEFKRIFQITGLGMILIGLIGFVIFMVYELLFGL